MTISTLGPSLSPLNSFACCLFIQLLCYVLLVDIFYSKIVRFLLYLVVGMSSYHLLQLVGRISFRCFGMSVLSILFYRFSISFKSSFFRQYFLFYFFKLYFFLCCFFFFGPYMFQSVSFVLSLLPVFVHFLFAFPVEIPILVLILFVLFKGTRFFSQTKLLHRLVHSIRLCNLLYFECQWFSLL